MNHGNILLKRNYFYVKEKDLDKESVFFIYLTKIRRFQLSYKVECKQKGSIAVNTELSHHITIVQRHKQWMTQSQKIIRSNTRSTKRLPSAILQFLYRNAVCR